MIDSVAQQANQSPTRRWRRVCRIVFPLGVISLLPWIAFQSAVAFWPYPPGLTPSRPSATWVQDRHGQDLAAFVAADGQWCLPLSQDQVSPYLFKALVAAEDARFYDHDGVDWHGVAGAAWADCKAIGIRRGASTITMQVQRLRDPKPRGFFAKFEQAVRACQLEKQWPHDEAKKRILLEYANRAPFGGNLVGAGAASWRYFGRRCSDLSLGQAALLAGLPQSPGRLRPDRFPQRARKRRDYVLGRMLAGGVITPPQYQEAIAEPIDATWLTLPQMASRVGTPTQQKCFPPLAFGSIPTLRSIARDNPATVVQTTLDTTILSEVADSARQQYETLEASGVRNLAVVVLDTPTGRCLAAVSMTRASGGVDLTRARRSTGSTLKPFIYAAAFDNGIAAPGTILHDTPSAWAGYVPTNFDGDFRGNITAAEALAESRNIPALQILSQVGVERCAALLGRLGLVRVGESPQRFGLPLAIGGAEASAMEIARAYATLARGGTPREVTLIPTDSKANNETDAPVFSADACWQTLSALSDAARTDAVYRPAARVHAAWKTGTSSGRRDAWCAAVTRAHTVVVWLGDAFGKGANPLVGRDAAAPLALKLIASLDELEHPAPWPTGQTLAANDTVSVSLPRRHITLLSPADGTEVVFDSDQPADRQKMLFRAMPADESHQKLWWFVDGSAVGETEGDGSFYWTPTSGLRSIRVVDDAGRAATARVRVE